MCGIFGFVAKGDKGPDIRRLEEIAIATETRGRHAFGFAWIDSRGRLKRFKQTGRISDDLPLLGLAEDARLLIGHCRYATDGNPAFNINNHPHPIDGGWFVHNGMIRDWRELVRRHRLCPVSHCDSEVIGLLYEQGDGDPIDRLIDACHNATQSALAVLALWKSPDRLLALRAGNPLHLGENKRGWYFASLADALPRPFMVRDDTLLDFARVDGAMTMTAYAADGQTDNDSDTAAEPGRLF